VDQAVGSHLSSTRHLRAVDEWLAELEAVDAFLVADADLLGGAVIATADTGDLERLGSHAQRVRVADLDT